MIVLLLSNSSSIIHAKSSCLFESKDPIVVLAVTEPCNISGVYPFGRVWLFIIVLVLPELNGTCNKCIDVVFCMYQIIISINRMVLKNLLVFSFCGIDLTILGVGIKIWLGMTFLALSY